MTEERVAIVTGASGFIGRRLCVRLAADGWRVHPFPASSALDIGDRAAVMALQASLPRASTLFHLGGKAHAHAELAAQQRDYDRINVEGTAHVLDLAAAIGVKRFVLAGSVAAIGPTGDEVADEQRECVPVTPYGQSKLAAERIVLADTRVEGVVLRFPMVFGGKDRGNMTRMVDAVLRRRFPPFPETHNRRSILHVDDAVSALLLAATHPAAAGETFIVTDGRLYSTRQIYRTILTALGRSAPRVTPPLAVFRAAARVGDALGALAGRRMPLDTDALAKLTDSAAFSGDKIVALLGFRAKHSLAEGIRSIVAEM